jgi:hypothetical protein
MAAINISSATDGATIYVQMTGYRYQEVTGAKSISLTEAQNKLEVFDLSTYRDVLSAGEIGRAWDLQLALPASATPSPEDTDDRPNHEPPREWAKPDTVIMWWDTAGGTGNCLAMCVYREFVSYSNTIPKLMF